MNICIIIPSLNLVDKLSECLKSISRTNYKKIRLIIVDNGSDYPLKKQLKPPNFNYLIIRNNKNKGFSPAINQGLKYGLNNYKNIDYYLLLNNDAYMDKKFFVKTVPVLKKQSPALLSMAVNLTNNRGIDTVGLNYYPDGTITDRKSFKSDPYLLGATCLFVSGKFIRECFDKFGWFFIPDFESYAEDAEISLRSILMGKKITFLDEKLVSHEGSASKIEEHALYLGIRNQIWTILTTWNASMIRKNFWEIVRGQVINTLIYSLKFKNIFILKVYFQTLLKFARLRTIRKKVQMGIKQNYPDNIFMKQKIKLSDHLRQSKTVTNLIKKFTLLKFALLKL